MRVLQGDEVNVCPAIGLEAAAEWNLSDTFQSLGAIWGGVSPNTFLATLTRV